MSLENITALIAAIAAAVLAAIALYRLVKDRPEIIDRLRPKLGAAWKAALVILAVALVGNLAVNAFGGGDGRATRITFVYSPEKEALLRPLIRRFNAERREANGGPVVVESRVIASGKAQAAIARGRLEPVAWSPAWSMWGRLLNFEAGEDLVPSENPSLVRTPLVIAMWEPMARALGWPKRKIGFKELLTLARSPKAWDSFGGPQDGKFKLGHTNPDFSTSGLEAVAAEYYAAVGKQGGVTEEDVRRPDVRQTIQGIERSIVHYGDTTLFFAEQLEKYGQSFASAVAMEEVTLINFNRNRPATRLVTVYPKEGTFVSDNPFIVLDAPWVSEDDKDAAEVFHDWLAEELTTERLAERSGFRPGDPADKPLPPVEPKSGADPAEPRRVLGLPSPAVLARIKSAWRQDQKRANVMLVLDTSGSMRKEQKLDKAKGGLEVFLGELDDRDRVGLINFGSTVLDQVPLAPFGRNQQELQRAIDVLVPQGGTAVYDATSRAVQAVESLNDRDRINAVVLLTDGGDTKSSLSRAALIQALKPQSPALGSNVQVYTVAYGADADEQVLRDIAVASEGGSFEGKESRIEALYERISSFF